jgi:copper chaperone CopZ
VEAYNVGVDWKKMKIRSGRLLVNPTARVESLEGDVTRVRVDGLVCSTVCAARTKEALEGLDGVRRVELDFDTGVATIEGKPHDAEAYERAVTSVVVGRRMRRFIEHLAARFGRRPADPVSSV